MWTVYFLEKYYARRFVEIKYLKTSPQRSINNEQTLQRSRCWIIFYGRALSANLWDSDYSHSVGVDASSSTSSLNYPHQCKDSTASAGAKIIIRNDYRTKRALSWQRGRRSNQSGWSRDRGWTRCAPPVNSVTADRWGQTDRRAADWESLLILMKGLLLFICLHHHRMTVFSDWDMKISIWKVVGYFLF